MQIYSTKDYSIFKKHESNRDIDHLALNKKIESLKKSNLLHLFPILIDKEFRVIDGQHRLEAAKILGLEVFYQIGDNLRASDMYVLNNSQSRWGMNDYLNFHVKEGNVNYINLKKFMDKNKINLSMAMCLFEFGKSGHALVNFKQGKMIYPEPEKEFDSLSNLNNLRTFIEYAYPKISFPRNYLNGPTFAKSFFMFLNVRSVSFELFMKKLPYRLNLLRPCSNNVQFLEMFREIYNFKNNQPISDMDLDI